MKYLIKKIEAEIKKNESIMLQRVADREGNGLALKSYLTKCEKLDEVSDKKLIGRIKKHYAKQIDKAVSKLQGYEKDTNTRVELIKIGVEWVKSRVWGYNPVATAEFFGVTKLPDGKTERYYFAAVGKASGCGYDKRSAAVAEALNQCRPLLAAMYKEANRPKNKGKSNQEIFGYGSGYGSLPYFEGGVGVTCYPDIFRKIGMAWRNGVCGKSFDTYTVEGK